MNSYYSITKYKKWKQTVQFLKRGVSLNKHFFSKEDIRLSNKHIKRCSTIPIIKETQIKTTITYCLISLRMVIIKNKRHNTCWQGCGEKGILMHSWQKHKLGMATMENIIEILLKIKNKTIIWCSSSTSEYLSKGN